MCFNYLQALCHKSELEKDHKSREHLDPIDDFQINDIVRGEVISFSVHCVLHLVWSFYIKQCLLWWFVL